jgi:FAD/FMN-containing dehydrogenase
MPPKQPQRREVTASTGRASLSVASFAPLSVALRIILWVAAGLLVVGGLFSWRVVSKLYINPYHSPVTTLSDGTTGFCNFDRQVCCQAEDVLYPSTAEEVSAAVVNAASVVGGKVRVVGAGHSMAEIVCDTNVVGGSAGRTLSGAASSSPPSQLTLLSLDNMQRLLSITRNVNGTAWSIVEVEAGMRLIMLNRALKQAGLGLNNMGMIQEQSIAGLIATGVHGTGSKYPSVSNAVVSMDIVVGNGTLITANATHNADIFRFARVNLGLLGVVVRVSLRVRDSFRMLRQHKFVSVEESVQAWHQNLKEVDHYQMWWVTGTNRVFENRMYRLPTANSAALALLPAAEEFDRATKAKDMLLTDFLFAAMTGLSAVIPPLGPLLIKLLPFVEPDRLFVGDSTDLFTHPGVNYHTVRYTEMEYFIPGENAMPCLKAYMSHINANMATCPVNTFSPVRAVLGDDIPLSPSFDRGVDGSFTISYVLVNQPDIFEACARPVEKIFLEFGGRPHWGKVHYLDRTLIRRVYAAEDVDAFAGLARRLDPTGVFTTDRLEKLFWSRE